MKLKVLAPFVPLGRKSQRISEKIANEGWYLARMQRRDMQENGKKSARFGTRV
jgi:hypothetical protein